MNVKFIVHGFVQGVGYRYLVKCIAVRNKVRGSVRNVADGTVEIIAEAEADTLKRFEEQIKVDINGGPSVMFVEVQYEQDKPSNKTSNYEGFIIQR
jgi:acylphosphatase